MTPQDKEACEEAWAAEFAAMMDFAVLVVQCAGVAVVVYIAGSIWLAWGL